MNESYQITVHGFKTKQQAEQFLRWYEGQGEQDASIQFEQRMIEGVLDVGFMPTDLGKTFPLIWEEENLNLYLDLESD